MEVRKKAIKYESKKEKEKKDEIEKNKKIKKKI